MPTETIFGAAAVHVDRPAPGTHLSPIYPFHDATSDCAGFCGTRSRGIVIAPSPRPWSCIYIMIHQSRGKTDAANSIMHAGEEGTKHQQHSCEGMQAQDITQLLRLPSTGEGALPSEAAGARGEGGGLEVRVQVAQAAWLPVGQGCSDWPVNVVLEVWACCGCAL